MHFQSVLRYIDALVSMYIEINGITSYRIAYKENIDISYKLNIPPSSVYIYKDFKNIYTYSISNKYMYKIPNIKCYVRNIKKKIHIKKYIKHSSLMYIVYVLYIKNIYFYINTGFIYFLFIYIYIKVFYLSIILFIYIYTADQKFRINRIF